NGTQPRTARQIVAEIEAAGGDLNAATSIETTTYYARVLRADVPLALDVLSDILTNPAFDPEELSREQNVIIQEIGASEDTPDDIVFDHLQRCAFPDQAIGRPVLGTRDSVRSINANRLRQYLARNYGGPDMAIAAAGSVAQGPIDDEGERPIAGFGRPEPHTR